MKVLLFLYIVNRFEYFSSSRTFVGRGDGTRHQKWGVNSNRDFGFGSDIDINFLLSPMSNKTENNLSNNVFVFVTKGENDRSGFIPARDLNSSVLKGIWRMPWQSEAKKDVAGCDKPRGSVNNCWSGDFRMGKPTFWLVFSFQFGFGQTDYE